MDQKVMDHKNESITHPYVIPNLYDLLSHDILNLLNFFCPYNKSQQHWIPLIEKH